MVSAGTVEAIRSTKAKYCRYIDTKQWNALEDLALPNAELKFVNPDGSIQKSGSFRFEYTSPHDFAQDLQSLFKNAQTLHQIGAGDLKELANGEVEAVWGMEDYIKYPAILGIIPLEVQGGGYYHETWQPLDGEWKLKSLRLERTYTRSSLAARLLAPLTGCI